MASNWRTKYSTDFNKGKKVVLVSNLLVGDAWSVSHPVNFTPKQRNPGYHCIRG
jgi:hypothetical protein